MDGAPRRLSSEDEACWVCLEGCNQSSGKLEHPCACPRGVHAKCLARWQLQSAGREEERFCRFCNHELPDWRDILSPKVPAAPPVMAIVYDGKVVRLQVKPGKEGMAEFQRQVRAAFNLGDDVELDCVFDCKAPGTGEKIKLRGLESYSAAMHCAAVAAGERLAKMGPSSGRTAAAAHCPSTTGGSASNCSGAGAPVAASSSPAGASSASPSSSSTTTSQQPSSPSRTDSGAMNSNTHARSSATHLPSPLRTTSLTNIPLNVATPLPPGIAAAATAAARGASDTSSSSSQQRPSLSALPPIVHASAAAAALQVSDATSPPQQAAPPSAASCSPREVPAQAPCHLPRLGSPRQDEKSCGGCVGGMGCVGGGGGGTPAAAGRRRGGNLITGLLRSLTAARRVM